jgi:hypothetical protein
VVGDVTADHRARRDDDVPADAGAGQDDRARPEPAAWADHDRAVLRDLAADRGVRVGVAVILVRDVDVRPGPHIVADRHALMRHDVAAAADNAAVADLQHGEPEQVLAGDKPR